MWSKIVSNTYDAKEQTDFHREKEPEESTVIASCNRESDKHIWKYRREGSINFDE